MKEMADSVYEFNERLLSGDFKGLGEMVHAGWLRKKSLASSISNSAIDDIYNVGMNAGAWGGKILGAGNGGCLLFFSPLENKEIIRQRVKEAAVKVGLSNFEEIPVKFAQSGVEILVNSYRDGSDHIN